MSDDHEWCQDVPREEAVRAAEDAAAVPEIQHRDLPEQVALLWASLGDIIGRVVRLEGEMDAGQDEEAAPAEGMRKERGESVRVVDEATIGSGDVFRDVGCGSTGDEIVRLTAERDAAIRDLDAEKKKCEMLREDAVSADIDIDALRSQRDAARCDAEKLKARVAELEASAKTTALLAEMRESEWNVASELAAEANAENAVGEKQKPWAWAVLGRGIIRAISVSRSDAEDAQSQFACDTTLVPLYAAPPEPRGWLTAEEREAVERCRRHFVQKQIDFLQPNDPGDRWLGGLEVWRRAEAALASILARSSPPRVRRPQLQDHLLPQAQRDRDDVWIAAIREAGGEVAGA